MHIAFPIKNSLRDESPKPVEVDQTPGIGNVARAPRGLRGEASRTSKRNHRMIHGYRTMVIIVYLLVYLCYLSYVYLFVYLYFIVFLQFRFYLSPFCDIACVHVPSTVQCIVYVCSKSIRTYCCWQRYLQSGRCSAGSRVS